MTNRKSKVRKQFLRDRVTSAEGVVKQYGVEVQNIDVEADAENDFRLAARKLRDLLRSRDNLIECQHSIRHLERQLKDRTTDYSFSYANRGAFTYAVICYGACFVKGGADYRVPLEGLVEKISNRKMHDTLMTYRHKLLVHLDENHEVRTDALEWSFRPTDRGLLPAEPSLNGNRILLTMGDVNYDWIEHVEDLIRLIDAEKLVLKDQINSMIGKAEVVD